MAKNYYSLVAGLREYTIDGDTKGFNARAIIADIVSELSMSDLAHLKLFYAYFDVENIINYRSGSVSGSDFGSIPFDQLEQEFTSPSNKLPKDITKLILAYTDSESNEDFDKSVKFEIALLDCYYKLCIKSGCKFLKEWSLFDRELRNVCAAYTARRLEIPITEVVVGNSYVVKALKRSSAADFGLKGEVDYIDLIMVAISEEGNIIGKEHKIDNIRWNMSDELSTYDYFNINTILAYLVKVNIIHRWVALDRAKGEEMLRKLIDSFDEMELIKNAKQEN